MYFVAICGYPGLEAFAFYSVEFMVEHWSDLEKEGQRRVEEQWATISPHPPPKILRFEPGALVYMPDNKTP